MPAKLTNNQFLELIEQRNSLLPPITPLEPYQGRHTKILFSCSNNHTYYTSPNNALKSSGCLLCSGKGVKSHHQFMDELENLNNSRANKVFVKSGTYIDAFTKMCFVCERGHTWETTPNNIINSKHTCRMCSGKAKKSHDQFLQELSLKRPDISVQPGQTYTSAHTKITFVCNKNHVWQTRPIDVLQGYGCPHCIKKGYSSKCIKWLNSIMEQSGVHIQHAENGGEALIPGTPFYADGYCKETNTVYEFYGDVYHGNPTLFKDSDKCHPYNKQVTAKTLYLQTMAREATIKQLGYNIVSMWEHEYNNL